MGVRFHVLPAFDPLGLQVFVASWADGSRHVRCEKALDRRCHFHTVKRIRAGLQIR